MCLFCPFGEWMYCLLVWVSSVLYVSSSSPLFIYRLLLRGSIQECTELSQWNALHNLHPCWSTSGSKPLKLVATKIPPSNSPWQLTPETKLGLRQTQIYQHQSDIRSIGVTHWALQRTFKGMFSCSVKQTTQKGTAKMLRSKLKHQIT